MKLSHLNLIAQNCIFNYEKWTEGQTHRPWLRITWQRLLPPTLQTWNVAPTQRKAS